MTEEKDEWMPIETAPSEGVFLVWIEEEMIGSQVHTMNKRKNITSIASNFDFDCPTALFWRPLPKPPKVS